MTRCFFVFSPAFRSSFSSNMYLWCLQAQTPMSMTATSRSYPGLHSICGQPAFRGVCRSVQHLPC